ncbi:MAG: DUF805 domain-containing protein [Actinomycetota bacterium]
MVPDLLSTRGRVGRTRFVATHATTLAGWVIAQPLLTQVLDNGNTITVAGLAILLAGVAWMLLRNAIRRLHDLDRHPALLLVGFIPLAGLGLATYLALAAGDDGPNRHGPPPRHRPTARSVGTAPDPESAFDQMLKAQNDRALRRFLLIVAATAIMVIGGVVGAWVKRVDGTEYEVLEGYVAPVVDEAGFTTTSMKRGDPSPCWWWCEDYVLNVDLQLRIEPRQPVDNETELCSQLRNRIADALGKQPDREQEFTNGGCSLLWDHLQADERSVRLSAATGPLGLWADLVITNESVERAFLPQCWLYCPSP